jgi:hypothetical protein
VFVREREREGGLERKEGPKRRKDNEGREGWGAGGSGGRERGEGEERGEPRKGGGREEQELLLGLEHLVRALREHSFFSGLACLWPTAALELEC